MALRFLFLVVTVVPPIETIQEDKQAWHGEVMGSARWWLKMGNAGVHLGQRVS